MEWLKTILSPFKTYLIIAGVILAILTTLEAKRIWDQSNRTVKAESDLAEAKKNCKANSTFTQENTNALDSSISDIIGYADSMLKAPTIVQPTEPGKQHDDTPKSNKPSGCTIEQRKLNDIQAAQLVSCQKTICFIYTQNGQENLLPSGRCFLN